MYEYNFTDHWTFNYFGSDLQPYKTRFDPKTHESATEENKWRPIETIVRLANDLASDQYLEQLDPKLDLRALVRYVAVQNFVGENDGFLGYDGMNNFYLYRKENSDQHVFVSWDEDNAFWGPEFPLDLRHDENVLFRKAMEVGELRDLYYATLAEAAAVAETPDPGSEAGWLESLVRRQLDMIHDASGRRSQQAVFDGRPQRAAHCNDHLLDPAQPLRAVERAAVTRRHEGTNLAKVRDDDFRASRNEHPGWVLDEVLDLHEELHRFATVHDAVIVAERQIHHRLDDDLPVDRHHAVRDLVQAENANLRRIENRRAHERAEHPAVGNRERAALQVLER